MSDYQTVRLLKKVGRVLTLEIVEVHPDMAALHAIIDGRRERERWREDAVKVGAMLLLDEKMRSGDIERPSDGTIPEPDEYVADVLVVSAEVIGRDSSGIPRYRAVVDLTVTKDSYAAAFAVDEKWGAVAYRWGDFGDLFL